MCIPAPAEGVVSGVSCKDISRANPDRYKRERGTVLTTASSKGGTADTWFATLNVIELFGLMWIVLENSDELVKDEVADWSRIVSALNRLGCKVVTICLDTIEFGLPNHRGRAYLVAIRSIHPGHKINDFSLFQQRLVGNIGSMRRIPPSCFDILFSPDDPRLQRALTEWLDHDPAPMQNSTADAHLSAFQSKRRSPLVSSYARLRCRDSTLASEWLRPLNFRMREVLAEQQEDTKSSGSIMIHDISQSISRCPRSTELLDHPSVACCPAILPGSFLWVILPDPGGGDGATQTHGNIPQERFLLADECLLLQGWPVAKSPVDLRKHSNSLKMSFAGNAFSGNVICSVFCSLMMSIEWSSVVGDEEEVDESGYEEAIALLDSLG